MKYCWPIRVAHTYHLHIFIASYFNFVFEDDETGGLKIQRSCSTCLIVRVRVGVVGQQSRTRRPDSLCTINRFIHSVPVTDPRSTLHIIDRRYLA